jgi:hypothetical protein
MKADMPDSARPRCQKVRVSLGSGPSAFVRHSGRCESIDVILVSRRLRECAPDTTWILGQYCIRRPAFAVKAPLGLRMLGI